MLATSSFQSSFRRRPTKNAERTSFGRAADALPLEDLIQIQKKSYKWFIEKGIRELFTEISPIRDFIGRDLELYFLDYYFF